MSKIALLVLAFCVGISVGMRMQRQIFCSKINKPPSETAFIYNLGTNTVYIAYGNYGTLWAETHSGTSTISNTIMRLQ